MDLVDFGVVHVESKVVENERQSHEGDKPYPSFALAPKKTEGEFS